MIKTLNLRKLPLAPLFLATLAAGTFSSTGLAQTITFPTSPLYTAQPIEPNFLVSIDNSGSTDWEVSFNSNGGEAWWNPGNTITGCTTVGFAGCGTSAGNDVASAGTLNFNTSDSSGMYDFDYLFPDGGQASSDIGGRYYVDDSAGGASGFYAIPPFPNYAWARMSTFTFGGTTYAYNGMYFDPTQTYNPWPSNGSITYSAATPTAVATENSTTLATVSSSNTVYFDLTHYVASNAAQTGVSTLSTDCGSITTAAASQWGFRVFSGMTIPAGTCVQLTDSYCTAVNNSHACSTTSSKTIWYYTGSAITVGGGSQSFGKTTTVSTYTFNDTTSVSSGSTIYIAYFPATFYLPHNYQVTLSDGTTQAFAAWYGYTGAVLTGYAPDFTTQLDGYEIKSANFSSAAAYNASIQNFANWFQYYRKRYLAIRGGMGTAFNNVSGMRMGFFTIDASNGNPWTATNGGNLTMLDLSNAANRSSFFDSAYSYYRGNFGTPNREAVDFMGQQYRRTDASAPITAACQKNFDMLFTDGYANSISSDYTGTTNANGDGQLTGTNSKYVTSSSSHSSGVPYYDNVSNTMADRAMYDYIGPLLTGTVNGTAMTTGKVAVDPSCTTTSGAYNIPYSAVDCNSNLHSIFYGVILNSNGLVYGINTNATSDPYGNPPTTTASYPPAAGSSTWNWPTNASMQSSYTPAAVDDMWHAAVNSRGLMFNAHNTSEITNAFNSILNDIVARTSSAAALAVNSAQLNSGTDVFQALYNPTDWSGQLLDLPVSTGGQTSGPCLNVSVGQVCTKNWEAGAVLTADVKTNGNSFRQIYTMNQDTKTGVQFEWANIGATDQRLLQTSTEATASSTTNAQLRLSWIRGSQAQEPPNTTAPIFRKRANSLLGDIVDSSPVYVGVPLANYSFNGYSTFRTNNFSRKPMVYAGANDGMLHGFQTSDGTEEFAFIPSKSYGTTTGTQPLVSLTTPTYSHLYTVDGTITVGDAYLSTDTSWHSILVGMMGYGGREVYALDVTNPSNFLPETATNASTLVKWEFTDANDSDLGYTFGESSVVKMNNGKFAAVLGNGYNSTAGNACLFVLFLDHASNASWVAANGDYVKICAPSDGVTGTNAPNGLSSPAMVDTNGDGVVDLIYAGDLHGNLWRFDVSNASTSNWAVTKLWAGTTGTATNGQPITDRPAVGYNLRSSGYIVYFGTGRYIDSTDNTIASQTTQAFYALYDTGAGTTIAASTLTAQTIGASPVTVTDTSGNESIYYTTSSNSVLSTAGGWYINMHNSGSLLGERIVQDPQLLSGEVIFGTLVPSQDPCSYGGASTLYVLNAQTGVASTQPTFDVNGNGTIDANDGVNTNTGAVGTISSSPGGAVAPSGYTSVGAGITSVSSFIAEMGNGTNGNAASTNGGGGTVDAIRSSASGAIIGTGINTPFKWGRQTWREVIKNN